MTIRARFDGKMLVPLDPADLPTDRVLEIDVREVDEPQGSPQALLRARDRLPPVPREDLDAMERAIEEGKHPPSEGGVFDELIGRDGRRS